MSPPDLHTWLAKEILVHERALRGYLRRFFGDTDDVDDALQETYARLLKLTAAQREAVGSWHAFLFTTARNVALDRLRQRRVVAIGSVAELERLDVFDERPNAYEELSAQQELVLLAEAIASLPERCRQVLTLRKLYGLSQREVAERLGISVSTVEKHVAHGVRLCAQYVFASREVPRRRDVRELVPAGRKRRSDER